ncbi:TPA: hypothetical protein RG711_000307 [Morganella morganii subsp. morganii]|nr:hypothetical protein [Morganella morganii subsp. morganii]
MVGDAEGKNTLLILSNLLKELAGKFAEHYELSDGLLISPTSGKELEYPPIQLSSIYRMLNNYSDKLAYLSKFEKELELDGNIFPDIVDNYKIAGKMVDEIIEKDDDNNDDTYKTINGFLIWLNNVGLQIDGFLSFDLIDKKELVPSLLKKRVIFYENLIGGLESKVDGIESKVETINNAHKAAIDLPVLLNDLEDGDKKLHELRNKSEENNDYINNLKGKMETYHNNCEEKNKIIEDKFRSLNEDISLYLSKYKEEAESYISKCEDAYRTTTSSGLAKAFEDKANKLNKSINNWVKILIASLIFAAGIGYYRLTSLEVTLADKGIPFFTILVQIILSALSLGIPLWLAWLATKQIGQRFRLAEDYEYKSAVSKAYEGYRREAVSLNEKFEDDFPARLFDNALTRLEEPPVRFVDDAIHSSPIMEFLNSEKVRDFFKRNPEKTQDAIYAISRARDEGEKGKEKKNNKEKDTKVRDSDEGENREKNDEDNE